MQITLNLATRPFADLRPILKALRITMAALVALGLGLGVLLHYVQKRSEQASARAHLLDAAIAAMNTERAGYDALMRQPANAKVLDQTDALNGLFDEKAFSWTRVMKDLEKVLPAVVELNQIEPVRTKDGKVTLHLRVLGPHEQAILLVENMERSDRFRLPRIVGEGPASDGNPNDAGAPVSASTPEELDLLTDYNLTAAPDVVPANYTLAAKVEKTALNGTPKSAAPKVATTLPAVNKPVATHPPATMLGVSRPPVPKAAQPRVAAADPSAPHPTAAKAWISSVTAARNAGAAAPATGTAGPARKPDAGKVENRKPEVAKMNPGGAL